MNVISLIYWFAICHVSEFETSSFNSQMFIRSSNVLSDISVNQSDDDIDFFVVIVKVTLIYISNCKYIINFVVNT